jgi:hypothetical protein
MKFRIVERVPLVLPTGHTSRKESLERELCVSKKGESEDAFVRRYTKNPLPPPQPPKAAPPTIPEIEAVGSFSNAVAEKAMQHTPSFASVFWPSNLDLTASQALTGLFDQNEIIRIAHAGMEHVGTFESLTGRIQGYSKVCVSPQFSTRIHAPTMRANLVISFAHPRSIDEQMAYGIFLGKTWPLRLSVYAPHLLATQHWFDVRGLSTGDISALASAAKTLGCADGTFSPSFMAVIPSSSCSSVPAAAALELQNLGITNFSKAVVLYRSDTKTHELPAKQSKTKAKK